MTIKKYHHGNLRPALIEAAVQLLEEVGPQEVSLREVARRAGVSHAAPYRHFADKDALLAAVAEEGFGLLTGSMRARMDKAGAHPAARLEACGLGYVAFAVKHPAHFRLMFGRELHDRRARPELFKASEEAFQVLVGALAPVLQAAGLKEGSRKAEMIALASWSTVHGLSMLFVDGQLQDRGIPISKVEQIAKEVLTANLPE